MQTYTDRTAVKPGTAANKAAQNKIDKYARLASTHSFYPFATETVVTCHDMAIQLTKEIARCITTITENIGETTFLHFQCLSMALQRGNAISFQNTMSTK